MLRVLSHVTKPSPSHCQSSLPSNYTTMAEEHVQQSDDSWDIELPANIDAVTASSSPVDTNTSTAAGTTTPASGKS